MSKQNMKQIFKVCGFSTRNYVCIAKVSLSLFAYDFHISIITPSVSNFERVHIDDYSCTRSTNLVIFTRGPEPSLGNGFPSVPLPFSCCFHAADPGPSIPNVHVIICRLWDVKKHVACVDGVDKAVVIRLVSDDGQSGPYLFALYLGLVVSQYAFRKHAYISPDPWHDLKYCPCLRANDQCFLCSILIFIRINKRIPTRLSTL